MEHINKITTIIIITILLTVLRFSIPVHSRELAGSPSPSPSPGSPGMIDGIRRPGSFPASCHAKCKQCEPCMLIGIPIRAVESEENEYYPQVWQCMCQENIYPP
ncbi:EPIDERMAL PATTERNING FACTOR-like protein 5 [Hibiscus syriacus]|uniref:EPIDERMAL PATTERNING FACTOR-like protein 5 n=1 Tax=Hibiscus syriacus TaxID=106335 RepID=UPI001923F9A3|nr:EPIDERMAL PATTERNING FACTOR-like protein 5 [Hibiscus syriacus]